MVLVCASSLSSTLSLTKFVPFTSQIPTTTTFGSSFLFNNKDNVPVVVPLVFVCHAKKKIGFFDQILDYIEGGWFMLFAYTFFLLIL
jgi:hypothetical protein